MPKIHDHINLKLARILLTEWITKLHGALLMKLHLQIH